MTVYPDGAGKVKVTRKYYGNLFETENLRYQFLLDDEKERHFNQLAKQIHPQAEISGEPEVDFSGYPAVVEFTVQSPQLAVLSGNMMTIPLPGFEAMRRQLILPGTERTLPLNWEQSTDLEINHHIESPYGFSLVSGRSAIRDIGRPGFARYLERSSTDRENIRINSKLHIQSGNFKPVDYDLLLNIQSLLLNARSRTLVFERKSGKGTL